MSSFNKIVSKKFISNVVKDGKTVAVSAATKTSAWTRDEAMAQKVGELLKDSLSDWNGQLPEGTEEICSRSVHSIWGTLLDRC
jgi:hypothetical protein